MSQVKGTYLLTVLSPHFQAKEDLQEKASVGIYPSKFELIIIKPSTNKQEDFVQFKKVTILLLFLLLFAFS